MREEGGSRRKRTREDARNKEVRKAERKDEEGYTRKKKGILVSYRWREINLKK